MFAANIARTAKDIEILIDSLPPDESSTEEHERILLELDDERANVAKELEQTLEEAEKLAEEIGSILSNVVKKQLDSRPGKSDLSQPSVDQ